ncbi:MAG: hypothetical protein D6681_20105 [Calditrichaeota bacterium]|nr:MAG: hypothetical protein D6681_20105 [Calditrichota bacterium]
MRPFMFMALALALISCGGNEVRNPIPENERPAELLKYAQQFYENQDYENAFRAYGIIYYNYPNSREYVDAAIGLAKCYGAMDKYEKEFEILYQLLRENLIPTKVPQIYNAIAEFYEQSAGISEELSGAGDSDYQKAIDYYTKALEYPNSKDMNAKGYAQYKIGTLYERMKQYDKAVEAYKATVGVFEGTEWAVRAEQQIAEVQTRLERRAQYERERLLPTESPISSETDSGVSTSSATPTEPSPPETTSPTPPSDTAGVSSTSPATSPDTASFAPPSQATDSTATSSNSLNAPAVPAPKDSAGMSPLDSLALPAPPDSAAVDSLEKPKLEFKE